MKVHTFAIGDVIALYHDTGAFGAQIVLGIVFEAGPKAYRVRWESGFTNRIEQGRTICWLYEDWKDWTDKEIERAAGYLGVPIIRKEDRMLLGHLVTMKRRSGWKLGIVVGTTAGGIARVCVWAANGCTWSQPQNIKVAELTPCPEWPDPDPSGRRRRAIVDAIQHVRRHDGSVAYKGGSTMVGEPTAVRDTANPGGVS